MKKINIILVALTLIVLAGCGKVHDPSSTTQGMAAQETEVVFQEPEITATNYTMDAILVNYQQEEGKHTYTVFVCADDAYAVLKDNCVNYLADGYQDIYDVINDINVQVWNVNDTSKKETAAFIQIVSPQILDTQKLFVYALGTTEYQDGMKFESVDE